jgi:diguanylate cyclase (GGDEF)-like protein/PAS domain S-box-containing protein
MHDAWTNGRSRDDRVTGPARPLPPGGPTPRRGILPEAVLSGVCAAYAVGAALGWGSRELALVMGDFGLSAAALLAAGSCLWYARTHAGEARPAWALFGVSSLMAALGNAVWGWYEVVRDTPVPSVSVADVCFLLFAPLAIIGLLMLAKRPVTRAGWACLTLDAWLIGGSLMTLSWSVALAHAAHWQGQSVARAALALAYPMLDIALVSMVLVLHFRRSAAQRAAIGALALTVLCDALFTSPMLRERYSSGQLLDAGWFAGSLLLACAPWMAGRHSGAEAADGERRGPQRSRPLVGSLAALMPYLAAAVCTLSVLGTLIGGREVDRVVVITGCAVVLALLVRQGITLMDNVKLTRELAQKESHFRSLVQGSSDVIMIAAPDGRLSYVSPAAAGVYGQDAERLIGAELSSLIHPDDLGRVLHELRRFLSVSAAREPATRIECRVRHGGGHWLNVESSVNRYQGGLILNSRDVTERVRLQAQLQHSASHDALTDLPNRALFTERVRLALGGGCRGGDPCAAVFFIDLDGFKAVNDTAGHQAGDELLVQAARRLRAAVRTGDTTARLGGDEFAALILPDPDPDLNPGPGGDPAPRERHILEIAERVRTALSRPYLVDGRQLHVAASIGIAFAEPDSTPAALMRNADQAMYRAKQAGKARVELYLRPSRPGAPRHLGPGHARGLPRAASPDAARGGAAPSGPPPSGETAAGERPAAPPPAEVPLPGPRPAARHGHAAPLPAPLPATQAAPPGPHKAEGRARPPRPRPGQASEPAGHHPVPARHRNADRAPDAACQGEFSLLHQPVAELADGRITELCALARRRPAHTRLARSLRLLCGGHREAHGPAAPPGPGGYTPGPGADPADGAPDASGWLLEAAVAAAAARRGQGHAVPVSVPLPARWLADPSPGPAAIEALLAAHALAPQALTLELADAGPVLYAEEPCRRLAEIGRLGVGIALGGLGGAGTPPAALHRLPPDLVRRIRLDRELTDGLLDSPALRAIAAALLRMAAELGIASLADGVVLPEQAVALRALGCRQVQGPALCEPLEADRLGGVLDQGRLPVPPDAAPTRPAAQSL